MSSGENEGADANPGKTHTWWHPLLAAVLRWQLANHYEVQEEVPVGQKPLQIDLILLHRVQVDLPEPSRRVLAGLGECLGDWTLVEFTSPSETLRPGAFQTILAYTLLYRAQHHPNLPVDKLNVVVIAPRLTRPYRAEMVALGVTPQEEHPGIWRLTGGVCVHAMWLLETSVLAGREHPLLTLFSPRFLGARLAMSE